MERGSNGSYRMKTTEHNAPWHDDVGANSGAYAKQWLLSSGSKLSESSVHSEATERLPSPELRTAFHNLLEKTKETDPVLVAEAIWLLGDLAANRGSQVAATVRIDRHTRNAAGEEGGAPARLKANLDADKDWVTKEYEHLLARGFTSKLLVDVLTVAGDLGAFASSPEGRKLLFDLKMLVSHLRS